MAVRVTATNAGSLTRVNEEYQFALSKDLGSISGLLFEIGTVKISIEQNLDLALKVEKDKLEKALSNRHVEVQREIEEESKYLRMQFMLTEIGQRLGYDVYIAANDRSKSLDGKCLAFYTLLELPPLDVSADIYKTISLIDVIWLAKDTNKIQCAFEIEKSTSIYSGILRLIDLASSLGNKQYNFFLVAPNSREKEIIAQLKRPSFSNLPSLSLRYILFAALQEHCNALCKFGDDYKILLKVAKGIDSS